MVSRDMLWQLFRHMEWADAKVWNAAPKAVSPPDERLCLLLVHIHVVQQAFLRIWTRQPVEAAFKNPEDFATLADVKAWAQPYYREAQRFLEEVSEQRLAEPVKLPWADQLTQHLGVVPAVPTLGDTCFQVTSHSTYHRGQVNARLRELAAEPPLVDYIAWIWFGKPEPQWS